jgi:hypothetical protein
MPFTVSHTIVALPFRRTAAVPAAALAVGAMAPDATLFVPGLPPYDETHSALGALTISTPVALVALLVWTFGIRWAFTAIQPGPVRNRLPSSWDDPRSAWRSFTARTRGGRVGWLATVVVTVIVGVYSHIAWDSFTHRDGWVVERVPFLRTWWHGHPLYDDLQNACSAGGMIVLAIAWLLWFRRTTAVPRPRTVPEPTAMVIRIALLVVAALASAAAGLPLLLDGAGAEGYLGWAATVAVQSSALLLVVTALALAVGAALRRRPAPPR